MQSLRFNHVFFALLTFCAASAFLLPRLIDPTRAPALVQNIFYPVSRPARVTAQWLRNRVDHTPTLDIGSPNHPRSDDDIRAENLEYHQIVANLVVQLQQLQEAESQRAAMGSLRNFCTPFKVTGGDTGPRQSLVIGGTMLDHLADKMAVVYPGGVAGQLNPPGLTGTRVRLITDRGFALTGTFIRYSKSANEKPMVVTKEPMLVKGIGDNKLIMDPLKPADADPIQVNDWLELDDPDWPRVAQGELIGRVIEKGKSNSAGFIQLILQPATTLMKLNEVMVVTTGK